MESPIILPYRGRIPYNYSSSHNIYMLTALDQLFSVSSLICINGAFNLVFTSTMYQICTKIQILKHRFKMIMEQLADNVQMDNPVEDIAKKKIVMTEKYQDQLIANWVESHNTLLSLYDFTKSVFAKAVFIHYVINSIFEDLRDMIFSTNWFATRITIQKSIIIIMSKSIIPVEFVSGYFVTLSLDSFKRVSIYAYFSEKNFY
ncbi:hypothetical protein G9C98_008182 [Cotesia typhae]|uniref:Uncharacterized protein n=1 Tax=Cotesia typhae TaxID=2053667 RepID=A0A8J5R708_9HYME|nr:hypothetical protein G9C98_008182 [Cotesia typhae]